MRHNSCSLEALLKSEMSGVDCVCEFFKIANRHLEEAYLFIIKRGIFCALQPKVIPGLLAYRLLSEHALHIWIPFDLHLAVLGN